MEIEVKDKNELAQNPNFQIQEVDNNEQLKGALIDISKLCEEEDIKAAKEINKTKVLRNIVSKFDKIENVDQKEIDKLKKKICTAADQALEDELYETYVEQITSECNAKNESKTKTNIRKEARFLASWTSVKNRLDSIGEMINNKDNLVKMRNFTKSLGSKVKNDNNKKTVKIVLTDKNGTKNNINLNEVNELLEGAEKLQDENSSQQNANPQDKANEEFKNRKKNIAEEFKKKKQDKFNKVFEMIDCTKKSLNTLIENSTGFFNEAKQNNPVGIEGYSSGIKKSWEIFRTINFKDIGFYLKNFIESCENTINESGFNNSASFVQIGAVLSAIMFHINGLELMMKNVIDLINNMNSEKTLMAKFGPNSMVKINQKINESQKNKSNSNFIKSEEWTKLSAFDKFKASFKFSDFTQNVPFGWWKAFTKEQKIETLKLQTEWKKKRMVELSELYKKDPDKYLRYIDTFLFYANRDKYGLIIKIDKDLEKVIELDEEDKLILNGLKDILDDASKKGLVFNKLLVRDKYIYGNGLSTSDRLQRLKAKRAQTNTNDKFKTERNRRKPRSRFLKSKRKRPQINYNERLDDDFDMKEEDNNVISTTQKKNF